MSDRDDIRQALYDAIGWQDGLIDAYRHMRDAPERAEAIAQRKRYKAILRRRYGTNLTALDVKLKDAVLVDAMTLKPR